MNSLRPLLLILVWLLALLPPGTLASIPRTAFVPPPVALFGVVFSNEQDCGPLTLHLDGLHDRAGPCCGVLVRQNPWTHFDPHGLSMEEMLVGNQAVAMERANPGGLKDIAIFSAIVLGVPAVAVVGPAVVTAAVANPAVTYGAAEAATTAAEIATGYEGPPIIPGPGDAVRAAVQAEKKVAKQLTKTGRKVAEETAETVEKVSPKSLVPRQGPSEMTGSKVKKLTKDMKENGFDPAHPIEVAEVEGKKIILDGHHRAEAAARAGIDKVPVKVKQVTSEQADNLSREAAEAAAERAARQR